MSELTELTKYSTLDGIKSIIRWERILGTKFIVHIEKITNYIINFIGEHSDYKFNEIRKSYRKNNEGFDIFEVKFINNMNEIIGYVSFEFDECRIYIEQFSDEELELIDQYEKYSIHTMKDLMMYERFKNPDIVFCYIKQNRRRWYGTSPPKPCYELFCLLNDEEIILDI